MSSVCVVRFITTIFSSFISLSLFGTVQQYPQPSYGYSPSPQVNTALSAKEQNTLLNNKYTRFSNPLFPVRSLISDIKKDAQRINNQNAVNALNQLRPVLLYPGSADDTFKLTFTHQGVSVIQNPTHRFNMWPVLDQITANDLLRSLGALPTDPSSFQTMKKKLESKYKLAIRQKIKRGKDILRASYVQAKYSNTVPAFINKLMTAPTFGQAIGNLEPTFVSAGVPLGVQANMAGPMMTQPMMTQTFPQTSFGANPSFPQSSWNAPMSSSPFGGNFSSPTWNSSSMSSPFTGSSFSGMGGPSFSQGQIPEPLRAQNSDQNSIISGLLTGAPSANLENAYQVAGKANLLTPGDAMGNAKIVQVLSQGNQANLMNAAAKMMSAPQVLNNLSNYEKALLISRNSFLM